VANELPNARPPSAAQPDRDGDVVHTDHPKIEEHAMHELDLNLLDSLRSRKVALQRSLDEKTQVRAKVNAATAVAVVESGEAPAESVTQVLQLDGAIQSLKLGLERIETDLRIARSTLNLAAARLEQKTIPLRRELDELYRQRSSLLGSAAKSSEKRVPLSADLCPTIIRLEQEIAQANEDLLILTAEIMTVRAPIVREENNQFAA
jgi:hypothetical protein